MWGPIEDPMKTPTDPLLKHDGSSKVFDWFDRGPRAFLMLPESSLRDPIGSVKAFERPGENHQKPFTDFQGFVNGPWWILDDPLRARWGSQYILGKPLKVVQRRLGNLKASLSNLRRTHPYFHRAQQGSALRFRLQGWTSQGPNSTPRDQIALPGTK